MTHTLIFLYCLYCIFTAIFQSKKYLKKTKKDFENVLLFAVFLNLFFMLGFDAGQNILVEKQLIADEQKIEEKLVSICSLVYVFFILLNSTFLKPFAKGKTEIKKGLTSD